MRMPNEGNPSLGLRASCLRMYSRHPSCDHQSLGSPMLVSVVLRVTRLLLRRHKLLVEDACFTRYGNQAPVLHLRLVQLQQKYSLILEGRFQPSALDPLSQPWETFAKQALKEWSRHGTQLTVLEMRTHSPRSSTMSENFATLIAQDGSRHVIEL